MGRWHDFFLQQQMADTRHVLIWGHGGGVSETSGLDIASRNVNWWLNCGIFPITTVWETGGFETIGDAIQDLFRGQLPAGWGFNFEEGLDRLVEGLCRSKARWSWREMKDNARKATGPSPAGGTLFLERLKAYVDKVGAKNIQIHLVAHSAGSIYQASMLDRMKQLGLKAETMTWLGPAITVEEFVQRALPRIGPNETVKRFTTFDLSDTLELNDTVAPFYHKSAVYLVARAFEDLLGGDVSEVPVLGLEKWWKQAIPNVIPQPVADAVKARGGQLIVSPNGAPVDSRTDARTHANLDGDGLTMTSVAMRALGKSDDFTHYLYQPNAPLLHPDDAPWGPNGPRAGAVGGGAVGAAAPGARGRRAARPAIVSGAPEARVTRDLLEQPAETAAADAGSEAPLQVGSVPPTPPVAPKAPSRTLSPEIGVAPKSGSPILDLLQSSGWKVPASSSKTRR